MKKYVVELTNAERDRLLKLVHSGEAPARMLNRARILLKADAGEHAGKGSAPGDREIARMWRPARPLWGGCASGSAARGSTPRWCARCPIGPTSAPSTAGRRRA